MDLRAASLHWSDSDINLYKIVVGTLDNNVFFLQCRRTGESVLLDAADEHETLLDLCKTFNVRTVWETHGHWDHIQAVPAIRDAGIDVGIGAEDASMLDSYDYILEDDTVLKVGELNVRTLATPGHTKGCISFKVEDKPLLFSGDSLFPGGPGRTDFDHSNFDDAIRSIDERMFVLPPDTIVLPGHGDDTTIGTERPLLDSWVERGY